MLEVFLAFVVMGLLVSAGVHCFVCPGSSRSVMSIALAAAGALLIGGVHCLVALGSM